MSELQHKHLADYADVTMGQSPESDRLQYEGKGLPFLQGSAEFGRSHPDSAVFCQPPLRTAKAGSVLISVRAPVGSMNYANQDYCIGRGLGAFKAKPGLSNTIFLKHAVELHSNFLQRRSQGSTFAAVSSSDVRSVPIPAFGFPVQERIASILSTIDTAIEQTEALIEKYQHIKAGLMHDLFTRGVLPNGQLRPLREQVPELYQETAIGWIPREWQLQSAGAALESIADGPFGSNLKTEHYVADAGVQVIRLQNVAEYEYDDSDKAYISNRHADFLDRNKVVSGDVLIAGLGYERYSVGRACCYPAELPPAINKADCFRARCDLSLMRNEFFMLFLNSELARRQMRRFEQGVTRPRINTGNMKRVVACIPDLEEQSRIISKFDAMQRTIQTQFKSGEALRAQKLGLMQDLLTGKVAVTVAAQQEEHA